MIGKRFAGIQPIKLGYCYFQMPTPLKTNGAKDKENEISYAGEGWRNRCYWAKYMDLIQGYM